MKSERKSIAIVFDDHYLFADSFSSLLERLELFQSVHALTSERELQQFLIKNGQTPVYVFLDFYLKEKNALPIINEVRRLNRQAVIIVVSSVVNPTVLTHIMNYAPQGIVSKSSGFNTIIECIDAVENGRQYLCPVIREIVSTAKEQPKELPFTVRELEVLQYFARGLSIAQTAEHMLLNKHTIVAHRRKMMAKARVNSITELLAYARDQELI